jgi:putative DNA primase/helicase
MKIDFDAINASALVSLEGLLHEWLPAGRREGHEWKVGSLSGEPGRSLSINLRTGVWRDFSGDAGGSDPISLLAAIRSATMGEAARELGERLRTGIEETPQRPARAEWTAMPHAPAGNSVRPSFRHRHGEPSATWEYRNASGDLVGYVCRFDLPGGGKDVLPMTWCRDNNGRTEWRWKGFAEPRPLYGAHEIAMRPGAGVVIVEGEKAADALREMMPGTLVATWPGGSKAVRKVDWSILEGRKVVIWPDADQPGRDAAFAIARLAPAGSIKVVIPPDGVPQGWDAADAQKLGWDKIGVAGLLKKAVPVDVDAPEEPPMPTSEDDYREETAPAFAHETDRLHDLPFRLLGVDGDQFFYMPDRGHQIVGITASSHTKNNLMRLASLNQWEAYCGGKVDWDAAVNALIQKSQALPKFDPRRIRGRGCWLDGPDVVFHAGDRLIVNGNAQRIPSYQSSVRAIYEGALEIPTEQGGKASNADAAKLIELCELLSWERPLYGKLLAGWLALAPICGALGWRPHLWVTGPSGSGKSWTVANIIQPMIGETAVHVQGNTSEAGIRGMLGSDALPVVFDEAESEDKASQLRFDRVLELARQASTETGAGIVKGTATGGSVTYLIRSMFLFASIGVAAVKKADTSRVTVLPLRKNLGPHAAAHFDVVKSLWRATAARREYCEAVRKRSLEQARIIRSNCETFCSVAVEFTGDKRSADQIGTLLAGAFSLTATRQITEEQAREFMARQDWSGFRSEEVDNDENQCLAHLFSSTIRFDLNGQQVARSVAEVVREATTTGFDTDEALRKRIDLKGALLRHGIKMEPGILYVANQHPELEKLFRETPWAAAKWRQQLERIPGAERAGVISFGTHVKQRAVMVPIGA